MNKAKPNVAAKKRPVSNRFARYQAWLQHDIVIALLMTAVLVILAVGLGYENNKLVPVNSAVTAHYTAEPHNHLNFLANWDAPIYLSIAKHGYSDPGQSNFFPLYPLLVRMVHVIVPSLLDAALLVSWACLVGAIYVYLKLVRQLFGIVEVNEAVKAALLFVLFPTGIFLLAPYTESLFALLALAAIYSALNKRLWWAVLFTVLDCATHVNGLFIALLVGLLLLETGVQRVKAAAVAIVGSAGLLAYGGYLKLHFHKATFVAAQKSHSHLDLSPHRLVVYAATRNGLFLVLLIITVIYWWQRRKSFAVYSFLYVCILFISGPGLSGLGRYSLVAFPLEFMLYDYTRNKQLGYSLVLALSAIGWAYFALLYMGGFTGG